MYPGSLSRRASDARGAVQRDGNCVSFKFPSGVELVLLYPSGRLGYFDHVPSRLRKGDSLVSIHTTRQMQHEWCNTSVAGRASDTRWNEMLSFFLLHLSYGIYSHAIDWHYKFCWSTSWRRFDNQNLQCYECIKVLSAGRSRKPQNLLAC